MGSTIGHGPGNLVPNSEKIAYLSAGVIAAGDTVKMSGSTGYTVAQGDATSVTIGIAEEAASAAGEWILVCVGGYTGQTITSAGAVDAGDVLVSGAAGAVVGVAPASVTAAQAALVFGLALAADAGTDLVGASVYKKMV